MNRMLAALALALVSAAHAQPDVRYYNTVPSSHVPAIVSDPSPDGFAAGDYVIGAPMAESRVLGAAPRYY